ncbi:hypothetical protein A3K73_02870 [Candidatus Pacearchaeota archaeon RBG_13_36_9]|nr:MAG: hypothetical protein A3K73_02870 [Candidatus Pacearchaeota archaeon RBG_13_36_9]
MRASDLRSTVGTDEGLAVVEAAEMGIKRNLSTHGEPRTPDRECIKKVKSTAEETDVLERKGLDIDGFHYTGKCIGKGAWGGVDLYVDDSGIKWGLKRIEMGPLAEQQLRSRGWTIDKVINNERLPLDAAYHHIVPRRVERDNNGVPYIAMPYHEEGDLSDRIYSLGINGAIQVVTDMSDALAYIHSLKEEHPGEKPKQKSHRDVKPANILLKDGDFYLTDFGTCTNISVSAQESANYPSRERNYLAPECLDGKFKDTPQTDIWSLGAIFYEMVAKKGIYNGLSDDEKRDDSEIISKIGGDIPGAFHGFLRKALAVDPNERYTNGSEMKKAFGKAIKKYEKTTLPSRLRRWGLAVAAAVVLAGASAGFVRMQNTSDNLEREVARKSQSAEFERKMENIRSFLMKNGEEAFGKSFYTFADTLGGEQAVNGWLSIFKDKKVGLAAYIDSEGVFASMIDAGIEPNDTSFDYKKIEQFLKERDSNAYWEVEGIIEHDCIDRWMLSGWRAFEKECAETWNHVKKSYQQEQLEKQKEEQRAVEEQKKRDEAHEMAIRIK